MIVERELPDMSHRLVPPVVDSGSRAGIALIAFDVRDTPFMGCEGRIALQVDLLYSNGVTVLEVIEVVSVG